MQIRTIDAAMVELALVARKGVPAIRWAATSAHVVTQSCNHWGGHYQIPAKSLAGPMHRGKLWRAVERTISQGRREVVRTFGTGVRALHADVAHPSMKA